MKAVKESYISPESQAIITVQAGLQKEAVTALAQLLIVGAV